MATPRFLVTAGNSREPIDAVRDWGARFTGNTGLAIAQALAPLGNVDLLTSNTSHAHHASASLRISHFATHADLQRAVELRLKQEPCDAVFMTAAVSDYRPLKTVEVLEQSPGPDGEELWRIRDVQAAKVKSHYPRIAILAEPTSKIIDLFRTQWAFQGFLVKFKLEAGLAPEELLRIGRASRLASGANLLVANASHQVTGPSAGAWIIDGASEAWTPRDQLPAALARLTAQWLAARA